MFYHRAQRGKYAGTIKGFPKQQGSWCKKLKYEKVDLHGHILSQSETKNFQWGGVQQRLDHGVPHPERQLVSERTQTESNYGFPVSINRGNWCTGLKRLTSTVFRSECANGAPGNSRQEQRGFSNQPQNEGQKINIVHYVGIAKDEPLRIAKHIDKKDMVLPLVQIGWDEDLCGLEATYMDMLSPTYTDGQMRDGCWFCHNQGVNQLRRLRRMYPDLWAKLMQLDLDSPVTFHADGHTVHDFDRRFQAEDDGYIYPDERFRWDMLDNLQLRWF